MIFRIKKFDFRNYLLYNKAMERLTVKLIDVVSNQKESTSHKNRTNDCAMLSYFSQADTTYTYSGKRVKAKNGDLSFVPASLNHDVVTKGEDSIVVLFEILEGNYNEIGVITPSKHDYKMYFEKMLKTWRAKEDGYYYKTMVLFYGVLGFLDSEDFTFAPTSVADSIKQYIDDSFTLGSFTINSIAQKFNLSEVYIRRIFKSEFGVAPKEYLQATRIKYACFLLSGGYFSVGEVAKKSGFNDDKYFSSAFKKETGLSPSAYAKKYKK